jgi:hypothetical protein
MLKLAAHARPPLLLGFGLVAVVKEKLPPSRLSVSLLRHTLRGFLAGKLIDGGCAGGAFCTNEDGGTPPALEAAASANSGMPGLNTRSGTVNDDADAAWSVGAAAAVTGAAGGKAKDWAAGEEGKAGALCCCLMSARRPSMSFCVCAKFSSRSDSTATSCFSHNYQQGLQ